MRPDPFSALVPRQPAFRDALVCSFPAIFPCVCLPPLDTGWRLSPPSEHPLLSTLLPRKVLFAKDSPQQHTQNQQPPHAADSCEGQLRPREGPGAF